MMIALGAGTAGQATDVLQNLLSELIGASALFLAGHDMQATRHADLRRMMGPAARPPLRAIGGHTLDRQVDRADLVEQQVEAIAGGTTDRFKAAGAHPERRVRLLRWPRLDHDVVEVPALAVMREPALAG